MTELRQHDNPEEIARDPATDLALIRQMMAAGRRHAGINGSHLVWWGVLLSIAFFLTYAQVVAWIPSQGALVWVAMMIIGWAGSFYLGYKEDRPSGEHNPALEAYGSAWLAVGITMAFHMAATLAGEGSTNIGATMLAAGVIGSAFFVMARVLNIRSMLLAAFGWWAILTYVVYAGSIGESFLLVLSAASFLLIAVPGLTLRKLTEQEE